LVSLGITLLLLLGAVGAEGGETPADLQFDFAEGLYRDNLTKQAIVEFEKFLKLYPKDPRASLARFELGECHYKEKRYEAALPAFEAAVKDEKLTQRTVALFRIGDIRFRLKDMAGAVPPLRAFLAADLANPDHRRFIVHARYALAQAEFAQKRFAEALPLFEQVLADPAPENTYKGYVLLPIADCLLVLGKVDDALGRYREMEAYLEAAIKAKPDGPDAKNHADMLARVRTQLASLLLGQKKLEEALAVLGKVDAAGPQGEAVVSRRAQALFALQRYQEALVPALDYLKRFPQGDQLLSSLYIAGECCYRTDRFAEAEGHFAALLAADKTGKDPNREGAAFYRAASAYRQGAQRARETAAAAEAFLKEFPKSTLAPDAVYFGAEAAFWLGAHADALERYRKVPAAFAHAEKVSHQIAVCLDLLKRHDEAAGAYEDYLKRFPNGQNVQSALDRAARLRGQLNQFAKAIEHYGEFFKRFGNADPKTAEDFLYRKGACEYELKQYDAMAATFDLYFNRFPKGEHKGDVLYFLAWYYGEVKKNYERAVPLYELCGGIPGAYQKRARRLLAHTYVKLGKARLAAKQQKEADELFAKAANAFLLLIREAPDVLVDAPEYLWTAEVFREQRKPAEAIEAFEALLKRFPAETTPYIIYWLGELASNLPKPDYERAKRYFKDFVDKFPTHELLVWAKFGLAEALKASGDSDGAWQYYPQVEQLAPNAIGNPEVRDGLILKCMLQMGRMASDKKNWEFAQKYMLRVAMLAAGEDAAEARYWAGVAAFHLGDLDAAVAVWNRLIQLFPKSPWTERLLKELDQYKLRLARDGKSLERKP